MVLLWDRNTGKIRAAQGRISTSKLYTLDEIKTLAMNFVGETNVGPISKLTVSDRLLLSTFIAYLQKREKEGKG